MNLVLLDPAMDATDRVVLLPADERYVHLRQVLNVKTGDTLRAGYINGPTGWLTIQSCDEKKIDAKFVPSAQTGHRAYSGDLRLVVAMPRPKEAKRLFRLVAMAGIRELVLVRARRVDKSFFLSPVLNEAAIHAHLCAGLSQSGHTRLPVVKVEPFFRPFVEDRFAEFCRGNPAICFHPPARGIGVKSLKVVLEELNRPMGNYTLVFGPEGGWVDFELEMWNKAGTVTAHLGEEIWTTQVAVTLALGAVRFHHSP